ncbi:uncharacterized protein [Palaemon carinicauda]|uniref:uncharacterized protein n=1 Tax=Palaemon carinicauda TaxID=392227 RepID=UPI0035B5C893
MIKDKDGEILTSYDDVMKRWEQYFKELLNRPDPVKNGQKQEGILSPPPPHLFNLLMEKVTRSLTARKKWVTFNNVRVNCLGYADDINIIWVNLREVGNLTTQFKTMDCQVGLEINEDKTKIMKVARTPQLQGNVDLASIRIETIESFKYLGTIMS